MDDAKSIITQSVGKSIRGIFGEKKFYNLDEGVIRKFNIIDPHSNPQFAAVGSASSPCTFSAVLQLVGFEEINFDKVSPAMLTAFNFTRLFQKSWNIDDEGNVLTGDALTQLHIRNLRLLKKNSTYEKSQTARFIRDNCPKWIRDILYPGDEIIVFSNEYYSKHGKNIDGKFIPADKFGGKDAVVPDPMPSPILRVMVYFGLLSLGCCYETLDAEAFLPSNHSD